ncbi:MAG: C-terminal binding protein [Chloroflexi bacterium]|nr:C-terminal binding protein [Chloroflexota bacterium]
MAFKVVARIGVPTIPVEELKKIGAELTLVPLSTEDEIIANAADADAILVGANEPFTAKSIKGLKRCKILARMGIGYNNVDAGAATAEGIAVTVVDDASVDEVSDHAMTLLLTLSRGILALNVAIKSGNTAAIADLRARMRRLNTQTLGLVGVGRIGGALGRKARAFGLRVIIYDPYVSAEKAKELGFESVDFETLLKEADYISIHAPLTPQTRNLFGLAQFKKMKPTAYIVNTARGGLIDEAALAQALRDGVIAGAGIDVTAVEPPRPDNPLIPLDNAILTGHSAFYSDISNIELRTRAIASVIAALQGNWPPGLVNPEIKQKANCRIGK